MNITVWGGAGFLGSHICDALSANGHKVIIADIKHSTWKKENQEMIVGSLLDESIVNESVKNADYVFNFAGIADIQEANRDPVKSSNINIFGNLNLMNACIEQNIKRYIFASSLYVYSNSGGFYRCTKQACEIFIAEYQRQYNLDFTILRFGSLYGLRSNDKNAIYRFIEQALVNRKISYFGSPNALREYIHVMDAASICCDILDKEYSNQYITITGHQSMRVGDLLHMIKEILGDDLDMEYNTNTDGAHYEITPYSFTPKLGRKYSPDLHIDLGQGLLQIMEFIQNKIKDG